MMIAYYIFSVKNPKDDISATYAEFASQILKMFCGNFILLTVNFD